MGAGKGNSKHVACDRVMNQHRHGATKPGPVCPARRKRTVEQVTYPCTTCLKLGEWRMNTDDGSWTQTPRKVATIVEKKVDSLWMGEELDALVEGPTEAAGVVSTSHLISLLPVPEAFPSTDQPYLQPQPPTIPDDTDDVLAAAMRKTTGLGKNPRAGRQQRIAARKRRLEQRQQVLLDPSWDNPNLCQVCRGMSIGWCTCGDPWVPGEVKPETT